ncbi:MAG: hypothetical protein ACYDBT_02805 [Desulfobulbaceae bacterium]
MKKLTALSAALFAIALLTGPAISAEMTGGEPSASIGTELRKQLSPNIFEYNADGVTAEEFRGLIDKHYGVAPAWEGMTEESLTSSEKVEIELRRHLAPNIFEYNADGVSVEEFRGIDRHYGIAPAWEDDRTEEPLEKVLNKHLSPNLHEDETSAF